MSLIDPPKTPPAVVRPVTHEDLDIRLGVLERHDSEHYTMLRNMEGRMEAHHLAEMEQLGILAKAVLKPRLRFSFWGLFR